jgi:hypothetical protein
VGWELLPAAGGDITADLAATLGTLSASSGATLTIAAEAAKTLGTVTLAAAGTL